jgi:hypothetical protein
VARKRSHNPGEPRSPEPPRALVELSESIEHPLVRRTGITTTKDGQWALYVTVPKATKTPLKDLEAQTRGFPVVYETEPDKPLRPLQS